MSDIEADKKPAISRVRSLASAIQEMRDRQADQDDVVVEMRHLARSRLTLLADDLKPVFEEVPPGNDQFEFALTGGDNARLWIDMTGYIRVGRDGKTYEFVKDTRLGRQLVGASASREEMASHVTNYIAQRMLERERILEADWQTLTATPDHETETAETAKETTEAGEVAAPASGWRSFWAFVAGAIMGAAALVAWAWFAAVPMP